jgi:hypothetical protein
MFSFVVTNYGTDLRKTIDDQVKEKIYSLNKQSVHTTAVGDNIVAHDLTWMTSLRAKVTLPKSVGLVNIGADNQFANVSVVVAQHRSFALPRWSGSATRYCATIPRVLYELVGRSRHCQIGLIASLRVGLASCATGLLPTGQEAARCASGSSGQSEER